MDINTILKLIDAGYTKDEIAAMQNPNINDPVPENKPEIKPENVPDPTTGGADPAPVEPEKPNNPEQPTVNDFMKSMTDAITNLTKAVQTANIRNTVRPSTPTQTAEDILYNMLNGEEVKK